MNKNDWILIFIVLIIAAFLFFNYLSDKQGNNALVYHENDLILTIDLNINDIYEVIGDNGKVVIQVNDNKIKVNEETSLYHLCSKQGYISKPKEAIICLPNKIIIEIPSENNDIDTEVK